jgi:hypothetical protein
MQALADYLLRAERRGELRFLLIGGRALEAHGVVRFTKDVDFLVATQDMPVMCELLMKLGYQKRAETEVFSRWRHPSMLADDVDVMYVNADTFEKLLIGHKTLQIGSTTLKVPSVPSLIALKLHAMFSNEERQAKDGADIAEMLRLNPGVISIADLEALFDKYGCRHLFPQYSRLVS